MKEAKEIVESEVNKLSEEHGLDLICVDEAVGKKTTVLIYQYRTNRSL